MQQEDSEDLTFKKADIMEVLRKDEDDWWFAKHSDGRTGSIPVPYVIVVSYIFCLLVLFQILCVLYTPIWSSSHLFIKKKIFFFSM